MKSVVLVAVLSLATPLWAADACNTAGLEEAKPNSYPYHVGVRVGYSIHEEELCDGALISKDWVITAAGCTLGSIFVVLGGHNIIENEPHKISATLSEIVRHPDWDEGKTSANLALIKLDRSITENEFIRPIDLPKSPFSDSTFLNSKVTLSGWGRQFLSPHHLVPYSLHDVKSQVLSNEYCQMQFSTKFVEESQMCIAGYPGKQLSLGDSGAPVVIDENGQKILVAIGSYNGRLKESSPAVFTRITSYLKWIHDTTGIPVE